MPKFCLFDASGYIHRAYHALPPLTTSKGEAVNAIFGYSRMISKVLREDKPDYVAVCFDTAAPTFRHEEYSDYKGTRAEIDSALVSQLPLAYDLSVVWGLPCVRMDGFEADDLIATLAKKGKERGWDVLILSGDKDILQLVDGSVHVRDELKKVEYDELRVRERYGVSPRQLVDVLSLMGDKVDNIPGVPGVGPKTASKLVADYGSIEGMYEKMNGSPSPLKDKLLSHKADVLRNRGLVALKDDVPIDFSVEIVTPRKPRMEELIPLLRRFEFKAGLYGVEEPELDPDLKENKRKTHTVLSEGELDSLKAELAAARWVSYDLETTDCNQHECDIVGVAISVKKDEAWYIPVGHRYPGAPRQLPWATIQPVLKRSLEDPAVLKCGQNVKFDDTILEKNGVTVVPPCFDVMVAAYCVDPSRMTYGLKALAADYLKERMTKIEELIGAEGEIGFDQVPIERAAPYASADAEVVLRMVEILKGKIEEAGVSGLFEKIEMPLVRIIREMESAGIAVDAGYLRKVGEKFSELGRALEREIFEHCGEEFVLNSHKQLARILFEKLKLPPVRKTKTGYSTDEKVLQKLASEHPVCEKIIAYRELTKLSSTYVDSLLKLISPRTGRVRATFHQTGTVTGRLSSSDPNLQNIPIRSEYGREIRRAFVPAPGNVFLSADYSQIDLRVLAHISGDPILIEAFRAGGDIHTATAAEVFRVPPAEVTGEMRRKAKAINFGIVYGQQAFGLSQTLGVPTKDAQQFIDSYFQRYAGVKAWIEWVLADARRTGKVHTLSGRLRGVADINSPNAQIRGFAERVAMNTPIQGSSADIIKVAMIDVWAAFREKGLRAHMVTQVHDELLFDVPAEELASAVTLVREKMEGAFALKVPLVVDMKRGPNWNDMEKIDRGKPDMTVFRGANPFDQLTRGVKFLLAANVGVFLIQMLFPSDFVDYFALRPTLVIHRFWIWQVVTYSFLHGNFWHLFFNVFSLWMFAPHVEHIWGTKRFLIFYFSCVLGAAATQFLVAPDQPTVGASGGIYGVQLAFGLMFPDSVIYLFYVFPLRAIQAVAFIALLTLVSAVSAGGSRMANFAHLGGMATGFFLLRIPEWIESVGYWRQRRALVSPRRLGRSRLTAAEEDLGSEVDRILEKISAQGVDSLTPKEHETMQRYAKKKK